MRDSSEVSAPMSFEVIQRNLRLLIVSDIDIDSAAKLADFAIYDADFNNSLDVDDREIESSTYNGGIDLCLACGPFIHNESCDDKSPSNGNSFRKLSDKKKNRTLEQDIANEGIMTCALSQLENIVCRLAYVPCKTNDPKRTAEDTFYDDHLRLTPNSRNIHNHLLPVIYGLGVAGIADYHQVIAIDELEHRAREHQRIKQCELLERLVGQAVCHDGRPRQSIIVSTHTYEASFGGGCNFSKDIGKLLDSSLFQKRVMLYICRASNEQSQQFVFKNGNINVLNPGSLRLRGEFALVDVCLDSSVQGQCSLNRNGNVWNINRVQLRNLNQLKHN